MSARPLFFSFPHDGGAVLGLVLSWEADPRDREPCPLVALEHEEGSGVFHSPHRLSPARLRSSVFSEDPVAARSAITELQVRAWAGSLPETETEDEDGLEWADLNPEENAS